VSMPHANKKDRPAAESFLSSDTVVMDALPDAAVNQAAPLPKIKAKPEGERYFASTTHIIVVCMLVISLLINVFLLYFLFRIVKIRRYNRRRRGRHGYSHLNARAFAHSHARSDAHAHGGAHALAHGGG
jgi:hypothetical protein